VNLLCRPALGGTWDQATTQLVPGPVYSGGADAYRDTKAVSHQAKSGFLPSQCSSPTGTAWDGPVGSSPASSGWCSTGR